MNDIFFTFLYTLSYYQIDAMLKPLLYDKYDLFNNYIIIFPNVFQSMNIFVLLVFIYFKIYLMLFAKSLNSKVISMSIIYIKFTIDTILYNNTINIYQYEFRRSLMWLYSTPLILNVYCELNKLTLRDISAEFHIISNIVHILAFSLRKTIYYSGIIIFLSICEGYFVYKLFSYKDKKYTNFIIFVWCLFSLINVCEHMNIVDSTDIQMFYLMGDMIAKLTTMLIITDNETQRYYIRNNIDLQTITLITTIKKTIKHFEHTNHLTDKCKHTIENFNNKSIDYIPIDKTPLKLELLKKILPLELEESYLAKSKEYKEYKYICVLFTDIVSYTELAKKYDEKVIYNLLNEIYTKFDDIIVKYKNLQKIETIGDAYMVVGDIYNTMNVDKSNVINIENTKSIILLAIDFLKEIKKIATPDGNPLQLRIGIHIGKVIVGILGVEIPRLCVIGNTVNVASRLQSTADADTIQISRHVYEFAQQIKFGMEIQYKIKEDVYLKNLGTITTYNITPSDFKPRV